MSETNASELLLAISDFLRGEVVPQLEGFSAYNTRVAANSLKIVARELQLGGALEDIDSAAAQAFDLDVAQGPVSEQIAALLKSGELPVGAELLTYLKRRTLKKLEIDNPKYSGYLQAGRQWTDES